MGYYTRFKLETVDDNEIDPLLNDTRAKATLKQMSGYTNSWDGDRCEDEVSWYDWRDHLLKVSEDFPTVTFILSGEGDENGDIWTAYARNGDVEVFKLDTTVLGKPTWMGGEEAVHSDAVLVEGSDHSYRKAHVRVITVAYSAQHRGYFEFAGEEYLEGDEIAVKMKVIDG